MSFDSFKRGSRTKCLRQNSSGNKRSLKFDDERTFDHYLRFASTETSDYPACPKGKGQKNTNCTATKLKDVDNQIKEKKVKHINAVEGR